MFPPTESADRALLLATVHSLDPPIFLAPIIAAATAAARSHLTIVLFSRLFNHPAPATSAFKGVARLHRWDHILRLLTYVYVQATSVSQSLDKVLMNVDVLLQGNDDDLPSSIAKDLDVVFRVSGGQ